MLFWRQGYHAVSTEAICKTAKVQRGSLYFAFPSKADILLACLRAVGDREWAEVQFLYSNKPNNPEVMLRTHLEWHAHAQRRLKERSGIVLGTFDMALGVAIPEPTLLAMREYRSLHLARLRSSIKDVLGPKHVGKVDWVTDLVSQILMGTMIRARLSDHLGPLEAMPDMVFNLIGALCDPGRSADVRRPSIKQPAHPGVGGADRRPPRRSNDSGQ
jgi:AcrR family transcriptional regulator